MSEFVAESIAVSTAVFGIDLGRHMTRTGPAIPFRIQKLNKYVWREKFRPVLTLTFFFANNNDQESN